MPLPPGSRLGAYEIAAFVGAGGMGEVYRARDRRLARDVAIKVLPPAFAADPGRLARFAREARVLASLNHPHIAVIHGLEDADGVPALVLELVEGPTLADRISQGPIPLDEALPIAQQIADALEGAHQQGVIHRDLKPSNIKLRLDGTVKVLDFGLAKALEPESAGSEAAASDSPTITSPALLTNHGVILGTAAYMSPEQARGKPVDRRTDIWAFGCVLYEMLTGRRAFAGDDVAGTIAAVVHESPAWDRLPPDVPPVLEGFLRRCLEKNQAKRVRDIGDVRLALEGAFDPVRPRVANRRRSMWWAAGVLAITAVAAALAGWSLRQPQPRAVARLSHVLPQDVSFGALARPLVTISPDASSIVYGAMDRLYRRRLDELDAVPIRGTDGSPEAPFFAPDGQSVGYWDSAAGEIRRVPLAGGTPVTLARASGLYGASWETDGNILYGQEDGIWRVSADGAEPEQLVRIEPGELVYGPRLLPDGEAVMFSLVSRASMLGQSTAWDTASVVVQSLESGERSRIVRGADARIVPTGHLVYVLDTVVFAVPFDSASREVEGRPVPVIEGVQRGVRGSQGQGGGANFDFSQNGTLAYVPAFVATAGTPRDLVIVGRDGVARPLIDQRRDYWRPRISPDGTRVAVEVLDSGIAQIWIVDVKTRTATPLVTERESGYAVWTPDGQSVIYRSGQGGTLGIYRQRADGSAAPELLAELIGTPTDASRQGNVAFNTTPSQDVRALRLEDNSASDFVATPAREHMAAFSPDGRWLAYTSNESGQDEVYVRPFPRTPGVARLVSVGGGSGPVWAPDGSTLYYRGASGEMMAVPTTLTPGFTAGRARPLFRYAGRYRMSGTAAAYDIHPDGQRFIMVSEPDVPAVAQPRQQVNVVINWSEELKRLAPR